MTEPTETADEARERLRAMAFDLATSGGLVEPCAFDAALDAYRDALLAAASPAGPAPATDRGTLRDQIRRVLCEYDGKGYLWGTDMLEPDEYGEQADAVLAVLPAPDQPAAAWLDAAAECDKAGGAYAERGDDARAGAAFALMETFLHKAGEAEYVATPCSAPNVCEDGGEPCSAHERLMGHAEGDHELCAPNCGEPWLRRLAEAQQDAEPERGCAHCGGGHDWDDCEEYTALVAREARQEPTQDGPRRGDQFEQWLKQQRDKYDRTDQREESSEFWHEFDAALDLYRLHADTGTPLTEHVCEARVVGACECLEQPETDEEA